MLKKLCLVNLKFVLCCCAAQSQTFINATEAPEEVSDAVRVPTVTSSKVVESVAITQYKGVIPEKRAMSLHLYQAYPVAHNCVEPRNETMACQCTVLTEIMDHLGAEQSTEESADIFIVPLDYLTTLVSTSSNFTDQVLDFVNNITMGFPYLHYGGSNHVFMCLLPGCNKIMKEVMNRWDATRLL